MKTIKYILIFQITILLSSNLILAQGTAVNDDNSDAHPSAVLDVKSSNKGFLMPRMNR